MFWWFLMIVSTFSFYSALYFANLHINIKVKSNCSSISWLQRKRVIFFRGKSCVLLHLFYETECSSQISIQTQVLGLSRLIGTVVNWRGREAGDWDTLIPLMTLELLSFVGMLPRTSTNRNHGPGCELGTGCQHRKSKKKALQKNVWKNLRNYPESRWGFLCLLVDE